ncbi:MAG: hypothetical protein WAZ12_00930 [Candidatus Absconditicoccaceae bacterium]
MTKHSIEVSKEVRDEYVRLKGEIKEMGGQEISDDHVLSAMIGGFFDSLEYMKKANINGHDHGHHHHDDEGCCGGKGDDCCSDKGDDHECSCK